MTIEQSAAISVRRDIAAPADVVWGLVSDVTRMGQWSPETTGGRWRGGATDPVVGARFRGSNLNGKHKWTTACTITDSNAGSIFAFEAKSFGLRISRWEFRFETVDDGCQVTESWTDQRGWLVQALSPRVSGVKNRAKHNEATMRKTLDNLAAYVEAL